MPDAPCNAGANWEAGAGGGNAEGGGTLTANGTRLLCVRTCTAHGSSLHDLR